MSDRINWSGSFETPETETYLLSANKLYLFIIISTNINLKQDVSVCNFLFKLQVSSLKYKLNTRNQTQVNVSNVNSMNKIK